MFTAAQPTSPVTVRLDSRAGSSGGVGSSLLHAAGACVGLVVYAPLLVLTVLVGAGWVGLLATGRYVAAALVLAVLAPSGYLFAYYRPAAARALVARVVGQTHHALLYRPRWDLACHAAGTVARVGSTAHVPGLVRHTRTRNGVDVLLIRMAPGQTLATWRDAADSLASTFGAHRVTVRRADRPGWVLLDVLRRDPLATERTAPDPARPHTTSNSNSNGSSTSDVKPAGGPSRAARALAGLTAMTERAGVPALTTVTADTDPSGVVIGRDEHGHDVVLNPYTTAHAGMQGATRSGKSSACYTFLAALAHRPDVIVTGIDPSGLLLEPFTTAHGGRGGALIATGTSRENITHAARVLADLVTLMDSRIRDLRTAGTDKLTVFTPATPAVWVVMEEYPGLLAAAKALDNEAGTKAGDRLAPRLAAHLGRLVKEGAKVGVLVLVLAQRMSADALSTDDRMNLALRLTLRVDNGDAVAMLHDGITRDHVAAVREFAPGVALVESPGHGVRRVRLYYTDYPTYRTRVTAGITATSPAPVLRADGTPGIDVIGEVIAIHATTGTTDGETTREAAA